jgi:hypothetical protein
MNNLIDKSHEDNLLNATIEYLWRKKGKSKPKYWQSKKTGLRYLAKKERCKCCIGIRLPTPKFPHSEMNHGITAKHVANLYGVNKTELLNKALELQDAA